MTDWVVLTRQAFQVIFNYFHHFLHFFITLLNMWLLYDVCSVSDLCDVSETIKNHIVKLPNLKTYIILQMNESQPTATCVGFFKTNHHLKKILMQITRGRYLAMQQFLPHKVRDYFYRGLWYIFYFVSVNVKLDRTWLVESVLHVSCVFLSGLSDSDIQKHWALSFLSCLATVTSSDSKGYNYRHICFSFNAPEHGLGDPGPWNPLATFFIPL